LCRERERDRERESCAESERNGTNVIALVVRYVTVAVNLCRLVLENWISDRRNLGQSTTEIERFTVIASGPINPRTVRNERERERERERATL
jgi:hypothetical protein